MMLKLKSVVVALLLITLAGASVFAKTKKEKITFTSDVTVNGTLVKHGTYDVVFDDQSDELSILKSNKLITKAMARTEMRSDKAREASFRTLKAGEVAQLLGVTFAGSNQEILVADMAMQAGGNN